MSRRSDPQQATPADSGGAWPSTRHGGDSGAAFGATVIDGLAPARPARREERTAVFDVCHVGVMLRALLFVHAAAAVGLSFVARTLDDWFVRSAAASGIALPGVLLWLLLTCSLKYPLGRLPVAGQWVAAIGLGAISGAFGASLVALGGLSSGDAAAGPWWAGPAVAGGAIAAVIYQWLRMRAQAALPAETTARLSELQSRIRPHFLFNTLNTALALVRVDPTRAELVLEDLAELFRVALSDNGASVSLGEEVELARRYLAIEQIRFGSRLKVTWELDPEADRARVPPLLLQPLVENAVRHGVEPADEGGTIRVRTRVKLGRVLIAIVNTVPEGPGRRGNGMALANVRERLRLMHDVTAQFETRKHEGVYRVQIMLPLG